MTCSVISDSIHAENDKYNKKFMMGTIRYRYLFQAGNYLFMMGTPRDRD